VLLQRLGHSPERLKWIRKTFKYKYMMLLRRCIEMNGQEKFSL
jgi:hypothetical protein